MRGRCRLNEAILEDMELCSGASLPGTFILGVIGLKKSRPQTEAVTRSGSGDTARARQSPRPGCIRRQDSSKSQKVAFSPLQPRVPDGPKEGPSGVHRAQYTKRPEFLGL